MSFLKRFPAPGAGEGLRRQQPHTEALLDGRALGTGTLYIADSRLSWLDGSGLGFSLEYPSISLHAVSRDLNAFPREHLYVMVNAKFTEDEAKETPVAEGDGRDQSDEDEEAEPIAEFRFVPGDRSAREWRPRPGGGRGWFRLSSRGPAGPSGPCLLLLWMQWKPCFRPCASARPCTRTPRTTTRTTTTREASTTWRPTVGEPGPATGVSPAPSFPPCAPHPGSPFPLAERGGQGDLPTFYTYEEGLSQLTAEGQATLERLEGMLAQSEGSRYHMAGVRTDDSSRDFEGEDPPPPVPPRTRTRPPPPSRPDSGPGPRRERPPRGDVSRRAGGGRSRKGSAGPLPAVAAPALPQPVPLSQMGWRWTPRRPWRGSSKTPTSTTEEGGPGLRLGELPLVSRRWEGAWPPAKREEGRGILQCKSRVRPA
uniref:Methylosome subunit pICln n=1 Tax=Ornithorhynchus anatinus TaxID=9258 RepID=A0A6I8NL20_ORNAN